MAVIEAKTTVELDAALKGAQVAGKVAAINFWASWAEPCQQVEAESVPDAAEFYNIESVPHVVFVWRGKVDAQVTGADIPLLNKIVKDCASKAVVAPSSTAASTPQSTAQSPDEINKRIRTLLSSAKCMVFIKGTPTQPRCGFSRELVEILKKHNVDYASFNILEDDQIRQGLKAFSNWPTYPQVYVDRELVGGLDIIKEIEAAGDLELTLPIKQEAPVVSMDDKLKALINQHNIVLFMKGSPTEPKCGFSRKILEILKAYPIQFGHFDILGDQEVREAIKIYSNWPTFPQLYVNGQLIGGLDIVKEMHESGDLTDALK